MRGHVCCRTICLSRRLSFLFQRNKKCLWNSFRALPQHIYFSKEVLAWIGHDYYFFIRMLRKWFPEFIRVLFLEKRKCSRIMIFVFRRTDLSFLSQLVDEIPWEVAVERTKRAFWLLRIASFGHSNHILKFTDWGMCQGVHMVEWAALTWAQVQKALVHQWKGGWAAWKKERKISHVV